MKYFRYNVERAQKTEIYVEVPDDINPNDIISEVLEEAVRATLEENDWIEDSISFFNRREVPHKEADRWCYMTAEGLKRAMASIQKSHKDSRGSLIDRCPKTYGVHQCSLGVGHDGDCMVPKHVQDKGVCAAAENDQKDTVVWRDTWEGWFVVKMPADAEWLRREGILMDHCLAVDAEAYADRIRQGIQEQYSLRNSLGIPVVDIEVSLKHGSYDSTPLSQPTVTQIRGVGNACPPDSKYLRAIRRFFTEYGYHWRVGGHGIHNFDCGVDGDKFFEALKDHLTKI